MKVLTPIRWILSPLLDQNSDPRIFKYFSLVFVTFSVMIIAASTFNIIENSASLTKMTQPIFVIATYVLGCVKLTSFISHKQHIRDVIEVFQVNSHQSKLMSGNKAPLRFYHLWLLEVKNSTSVFYQKAAEISGKVFKVMAYFQMSGVIVLLFSPIGYLLFQIHRGNYTPGMRVLPFKCRWESGRFLNRNSSISLWFILAFHSWIWRNHPPSKSGIPSFSWTWFSCHWSSL